jgi:hypothetical protein
LRAISNLFSFLIHPVEIAAKVARVNGLYDGKFSM